MAVAPPASLLLVHGAGSGPSIFAGWQASFSGVSVLPIDLQKGLQIASASHADYARAVVHAAGRAKRPLALCGWSMGGLVVLQAAEAVRPESVVLIEPSPPGELQGFDRCAELNENEGTFDPEMIYGPFPAGVSARAESALARAERKRGISVPSLRCRSLVVYGDDYREERGRRIAELYGSEELDFAGLSHWDLVLDPRVRQGIALFLGLVVTGTRRRRSPNA